MTAGSTFHTNGSRILEHKHSLLTVFVVFALSSSSFKNAWGREGTRALVIDDSRYRFGIAGPVHDVVSFQKTIRLRNGLSLSLFLSDTAWERTRACEENCNGASGVVVVVVIDANARFDFPS